MANEQIATFGPYGFLVPGTPQQHWNDGTYNTIRELNIYSDNKINSIEVVYDNEGTAVPKAKHGGTSGTLNTVKLNYPTEYLVSISGYYGSLGSYVVVKSLTLHSNVKPYGPYGKEEGTRFITPLGGGNIFGGKIVGLFGRAGSYLDSIGVYVKPLPTTIPNVGPFGTTSGQQWDDGTYSMVKELIIHSGAVIDSIQILYDSQGQQVLGEKHGSDGGQQNLVTLDQDEYLLSFWGYYGQVDNMIVIRSLGFQSNKRMIGPFGVEDGEKFQSPYVCGKIIGFYGRSDKYLTSIGAYLDK